MVLVLAGGGVALLASQVEKPQVEAAEPRPAVSRPERLAAFRGREECGPLRYGGEGRPDVALGVAFYERLRVAEAVEVVLAERGWRAGPWRVGLHWCDETSRSRSRFDTGPYTCEVVAKQLKRAESVVGFVGPLGTCAYQVLSELGDLPTVSGTVTGTCFTRRSSACGPWDGQGTAAFARTVPPDAVQAAALAELAAAEGLRRVVVLDDRESYGIDIADAFAEVAPRLGVDVAARLSWDPKAEGYAGLMRKVSSARPDAVLLAGLHDENGPAVVRAKVAALGPNDGAVRLLAPDEFAVDTMLGKAAEGMLVTGSGLAVDDLPEPGRELVATLRDELGDAAREEWLPLLVYAAQAAEVLLDAIARSDGTRAGVLAALPEIRIEDGLIGDFGLDEHGDATLRAVTVYRVEGGRLVPDRVLDPDAALVDAAARG